MIPGIETSSSTLRKLLSSGSPRTSEDKYFLRVEWNWSVVANRDRADHLDLCPVKRSSVWTREHRHRDLVSLQTSRNSRQSIFLVCIDRIIAKPKIFYFQQENIYRSVLDIRIDLGGVHQSIRSSREPCSVPVFRQSSSCWDKYWRRRANISFFIESGTSAETEKNFLSSFDGDQRTSSFGRYFLD